MPAGADSELLMNSYELRWRAVAPPSEAKTGASWITHRLVNLPVLDEAIGVEDMGIVIVLLQGNSVKPEQEREADPYRVVQDSPCISQQDRSRWNSVSFVFVVDLDVMRDSCK